MGSEDVRADAILEPLPPLDESLVEPPRTKHQAYLVACGLRLPSEQSAGFQLLGAVAADRGDASAEEVMARWREWLQMCDLAPYEAVHRDLYRGIKELGSNYIRRRRSR